MTKPANEQDQEQRGLVCPNPQCGCRHFIVIETRRTVKGLRRRKRCRHCGRMVTTVEKFKDGGAITKKPA